MKVEELERFGGNVEMPKEAVKKQGKIMFRALRQRFPDTPIVADLKSELNRLREELEVPAE